MRRRRRRGIVSFILTIVLLAVIVGGVGILSKGFKDWNVLGWFTDKQEEQQEEQLNGTDEKQESSADSVTLLNLSNEGHAQSGLKNDGITSLSFDNPSGRIDIPTNLGAPHNFLSFEYIKYSFMNMIVFSFNFSTNFVYHSFEYNSSRTDIFASQTVSGISEFYSPKYNPDTNTFSFSTWLDKSSDLDIFFPSVLKINLVDPKPQVPLPQTPAKEGYTFNGWYFDANCTLKYDGRPIYADTNLYAGWTVNKYTVIFNVDGGNAISNVVLDYNTNYTNLPKPIKDGYDFLGWYTQDDILYSGGAVKSDFTLRAKWQEKIYTVRFMLGDNVYTTLQAKYGAVLVDVLSNMNLSGYSIKNINTSGFIGDFSNAVVSNDMSIDIVEKSFADSFVTNWVSYAIAVGILIAVLGLVIMIVTKSKKGKNSRYKRG